MRVFTPCFVATFWPRTTGDVYEWLFNLFGPTVTSGLDAAEAVGGKCLMVASTPALEHMETRSALI